MHFTESLERYLSHFYGNFITFEHLKGVFWTTRVPTPALRIYFRTSKFPKKTFQSRIPAHFESTQETILSSPRGSLLEPSKTRKPKTKRDAPVLPSPSKNLYV